MNRLQNVVDTISKYYGFKKELITDIEMCGLWYVKFTVNNIRYYGSVCYYGALPMLSVAGYCHKYSWHGVPVTEEYYKRHIEGRTLYLRTCVDEDAGEWIWLDVTFKSVEEAEEFIKSRKNPAIYDYDIKYEK